MSIFAAGSISRTLGSRPRAAELHGSAMVYAVVPAWHAACDSSPARTAVGRSQRVNRRTSRCIHSIRAVAERPIARRWLAATAGWRSALRRHVARQGPGHDQGRHPAFALRHHGDQRDHAEGRHADADRGAEQEGRPARQEARGGGRRPGLELAAVRREGARADHQGQGRRPCSAAGPRCRASPCCRCSRS